LTRYPLNNEEEARIQAGITSDPDNPELTDAQLSSARPFADALPEQAESIRRAHESRDPAALKRTD